jgi:hypothetical protein
MVALLNGTLKGEIWNLVVQVAMQVMRGATLRVGIREVWGYSASI